VRRTLDYLSRHALAAAAFACSILALAGSSYAAFTINGNQIVNHTIAPSKFDPKFINGTVRAWAVVDAKGRVLAGAGRPQIAAFALGLYEIGWRGVTLPLGQCETSASIDQVQENPSGPGVSLTTAGFVTASTTGGVLGKRRRTAGTAVQTFNQAGQPTSLGFDVAVIC
jgi:hypothetical protein